MLHARGMRNQPENLQSRATYMPPLNALGVPPGIAYHGRGDSNPGSAAVLCSRPVRRYHKASGIVWRGSAEPIRNRAVSIFDKIGIWPTLICNNYCRFSPPTPGVMPPSCLESELAILLDDAYHGGAIGYRIGIMPA